MTKELNFKKLYKEHGLKFVTYDIEKAPGLGYIWNIWDPAWMRKENSSISSIAYKWGHENKVRTITFTKKQHKEEFRNDKILLAEMSEVFNQADFLIGHNSDKFDWPNLNGAIARYGLEPVKNPKMLDTMKMSKNGMKFDSHSLKELCKVFDIPLKLETEKGLFVSSMYCWKKYKALVAYNKGDIVSTEALFLRLLPYAKPIVNLGKLLGKTRACTSCGSTDLVKWSSYILSSGSKVQRFKCNTCGSTRNRGNAKGNQVLVAV